MAEAPKPDPPQGRDVVDGVPNRAARRPRWKYLLLAGLFVGWCGVLITLFLLGRR